MTDPKPRDLGNDLFRVRVLEKKNELIVQTVRGLDMTLASDRAAAMRMAYRIEEIITWYDARDPKK